MENTLVSLMSFGLLVYLIAAMIRPQWF